MSWGRTVVSRPSKQSGCSHEASETDDLATLRDSHARVVRVRTDRDTRGSRQRAAQCRVSASAGSSRPRREWSAAALAGAQQRTVGHRSARKCVDAGRNVCDRAARARERRNVRIRRDRRRAARPHALHRHPGPGRGGEPLTQFGRTRSARHGGSDRCDHEFACVCTRRTVARHDPAWRRTRHDGRAIATRHRLGADYAVPVAGHAVDESRGEARYTGARGGHPRHTAHRCACRRTRRIHRPVRRVSSIAAVRRELCGRRGHSAAHRATGS